MGRKIYLGLFLASLLLSIRVAAFQTVPGYMDADYYYAGGLRIASGEGALEPYLWNYLNAPERIPAPAFAYWMPLVSLLSAAGLILAPAGDFWAGRLFFLLLSAAAAPLTALLAYRITCREASARLAGLLALFPGFYLAYTPTTDAFAVYMLLGGLFLLLASERGSWAGGPRLFLLGLLAGLLHLARADGLLWLGAAGLVGLGRAWPALRERKVGPGLACLSGSAVLVMLGYGLVMAPWYARNLREWGALFPPGGARAIWITAYEQTMIYPAELLTSQRWLAAGWGAHLQARWAALSGNLQTMLAVQGGVVLLPFMAVGLWQMRRDPRVRLGVAMWLLTLAVMTLVFPLAGMNGGFFHSGAAVQVLLWAAAPVGIEYVMLKYAGWRRIPNLAGMVRFMSVLLVLVAALLSLLLTWNRVIGSQPGALAWEASSQHYRAVEQRLVELGAAPGEVVLVNNPPGYWLAARRAALVIPNGDEQMLLAAAHQYGARYLILEINNPPPLVNLYTLQPVSNELHYLDTVGQTRLFRIDPAR